MAVQQHGGQNNLVVRHALAHAQCNGLQLDPSPSKQFVLFVMLCVAIGSNLRALSEPKAQTDTLIRFENNRECENKGQCVGKMIVSLFL